MLIHEAANITGLSVPTIRYYEQEGLLNEHHVKRDSNGYRSYSPHAVERLQHIKHARASGLTLAEIRKLMAASENGMLNAKERRTFLHEKIANLSEKITALEAMRAGFEKQLKELKIS